MYGGIIVALLEHCIRPSYTLLSAPRATRKGWDRRYTNPQIYLFYFIYVHALVTLKKIKKNVDNETF
jgi:hypothetical protein